MKVAVALQPTDREKEGRHVAERRVKLTFVVKRRSAKRVIVSRKFRGLKRHGYLHRSRSATASREAFACASRHRAYVAS